MVSFEMPYGFFFFSSNKNINVSKLKTKNVGHAKLLIFSFEKWLEGKKCIGWIFTDIHLFLLSVKFYFTFYALH